MILKNEWGKYALTAMILKNWMRQLCFDVVEKNEVINNIYTDFLDCYVFFLWIIFYLLYCYDISLENFTESTFFYIFSVQPNELDYHGFYLPRKLDLFVIHDLPDDHK